MVGYVGRLKECEGVLKLLYVVWKKNSVRIRK